MNTAIVVLSSIVVLALFSSVVVAVISEIQGRPRRVGGGDGVVGAAVLADDASGGDCGGHAGDAGGHF